MTDSMTRLSRDHRAIPGDSGDAEDMAQEPFLRLSARDPGEILDVRGWLTVVTSRLCLNLVRSARHRRVSPGDAVMLEGQVPVNQIAGPDPTDRAQHFTQSAARKEMGEIGVLLVDGYHSEEQARFDPDNPYPHTVLRDTDALRRDPAFGVLALPFGDGLCVVLSAEALS